MHQTLQTEAAQFPIGSFLSAEESAQAANSLAADLFADPTNLQLNFAMLKRQLAAANYSQAMMTLDRIQILDPLSRLAKILCAELQFRLGNQAVAGILSLSAKARFLHQFGGHHLVVLQECRCIHGL